jgi:membrane fusion protein, heavy metal efflux system
MRPTDLAALINTVPAPAMAVAAAVCALLACIVLRGTTGEAAASGSVRASNSAHAAGGAGAASADTLELKPSQLGAIRIAPLGDHEFVYRKQAVGIIDFNQDLNVQVFTPYQGRIIQTYADLGDAVKQGQVLFTIESADFLAAQSNLIAAAATLEQSASALQRAIRLYAAHGIDQNDYEAAVASQQAAEGALKAARHAVAIFGRTEAQIDRIVAKRQVDPALIVKAPLTGRITARNAAPGLLVQPGNAPAPYSVADLRTKWMVANVIESDSPLYRPGQPIRATVMAYPGRSFEGTISRLGRSLDPNTHRIVVRCEISDPKDELIAGMLASFAIQVRDPVKSLAIPVNGVVRNGDGSFAAWITTDRRRFTQRIVRLGEPLDGQYPVVGGLQRGELVITDGAVFVSNILYAPATD